ncbi:MAG: thioesterase family protein [Pseudomonadota bacterium]
MPPESQSVSRENYPLLKTIVTRWSDYDMLQHINNVQYYRYFEYVILDNLADLGTDWIADPIIPFVVESNCHFRKPIPRMRTLEGGLGISNLGSSSVRYEIALFEAGAAEPSATGYFVHVYIDRATETPQPVPQNIREALERLRVLD